MEENEKWAYRIKVIGWFILFGLVWVSGLQLGYWIGNGLLDEKIKYENL